MWSWSNRLEWVNRLLGILEHRVERDKIFTPTGPKLNASDLHPWVWNAARDLWKNGHYREAVQAGATAVETHTKLKTNRNDIAGTNLYTGVFNTTTKPGERRLRFPDIDENSTGEKPSQDWTNAHDGAASFGRGFSMAIRNRVTHSVNNLTQQTALEFLAALSILARWVDNAEVQIG